VNLVKQLLQTILKGLVFGALVEFAHKVAAGAEGVVAESQGSIAEILPFENEEAIASAKCTSIGDIASEGAKRKEGRDERRNRAEELEEGKDEREVESKRRLTMLPA